jgi:hypothetical protein
MFKENFTFFLNIKLFTPQADFLKFFRHVGKPTTYGAILRQKFFDTPSCCIKRRRLWSKLTWSLSHLLFELTQYITAHLDALAKDYNSGIKELQNRDISNLVRDLTMTTLSY